MLAKSEELRVNKFEKIVGEIPKDMLVAEQEKPKNANDFGILNSNLFVQMMESHFFDEIFHFETVINFFPEEQREKYLPIADIMEKIHGFNEVAITISELNREKVVIAFQALLLCVRSKENKRAFDALKNFYNNVGFIEQVLFEKRFLEKLNAVKTTATVDYFFNCIMDLFQKRDKAISLRFIATFRTACLDYRKLDNGGFICKSRINVKNLNYLSCAAFLGIFYQEYSDDVLKKVELKKYLAELNIKKKDIENTPEKQILTALLKFVMKCFLEENRPSVISGYRHFTGIHALETLSCIKCFVTARLLVNQQETCLKVFKSELDSRIKELETNMKGLETKNYNSTKIVQPIRFSETAEVTFFDKKLCPSSLSPTEKCEFVYVYPKNSLPSAVGMKK